MKKVFTLITLLTLLLAQGFGQNCPNSDFSHLNFDYWQGYFQNLPGQGYIPGISPGHHTIITQSFVDTNTCGGLTVPPPGYDVCAKLGNTDPGLHRQKLVYYFTVDPANPAFIFKYAAILQISLAVKPNTPYFSYRIYNANNQPISQLCGIYEAWADPTYADFNLCFGSTAAVIWKGWTTVGVDLSLYPGQQLHIEFTARDSPNGNLFGYAYITTECASMNIDQSFCQGTDSVVLTAPPDFSYIWNTGDTTQSITVLNPVVGTNYICNVISSQGCFFHLSTTIAGTVMNPAFTSYHDTCSRTVAFTNTSNTTTGNVFASHWDFGDGTYSALPHPSHTYPTPGIYNVTLNISTVGGCDSSVNQQVTIGNVPLALFTANDTCVNMPVNFHNNSYAQDTVVSWLWNFGDNSPPNTTDWNPSHIYTTPGNYVVTLFATNLRGCTDSIQHVVIVYAVPKADFSATLPLCSGQTTTITFTGISTPLTNYNWNFNGGTILSGSGAGPYEVSWPIAGTYQVHLQIIDPICNNVSDTSLSLVINPTPLANAGGDTTICLGHSVMLSGSGGLFYNWGPAGSLSNIHIQHPIASPTTNTTYTVTVSEFNCASTDQVIITVEPLHPVSVTPDTMICDGQKVILHASGGVNYLWSPANLLNSATIPNPLASPIVTTPFTVTITDNTGCMAIEHVTVTLSGAINSAFFITNDTICAGINTTIYFNGGTINPFASYNWDFSGGTISFGSGIGPYVVHWNTGGTYNVTLSVAETPCDTSTTVYTVFVKPGPPTDAGPNDTICVGEVTILTASGGLSYNWWPSTGLVDPVSSTTAASPPQTTIYHVWVWANGCLGQDSMELYVKPLPPVFAGNDTMVCLGDSIQLNATGGVIYQWSPPIGLSAINIADPMAYPSIPTLYTVSATGANGCSASDDIMVGVTNKPTSSFSADLTQICIENSMVLTYTGTASSSAVYTWDFAGGTIIAGTGQGPYTVNWPAPGNYVLTLVVEENGCLSTVSTLPVTVTKIVVGVLEHIDISCKGDTNGIISVEGSGGATPYDYLWNTLQNTATITGLLAGTYTVTVTDINGCKGVTSITITEPDSLLSLINVPQSIACQNVCDGVINVEVSGGTTPYAYLWNTTPPQTSQEVNELCPGNYSVTITDEHGCVSTISTNLVASTNIEASCISDVTIGVTPLNVNFTFTGFGANSYTWDFGDNTTSSLLNPTHIYTAIGDYQVILIINSLDPDFCTDTAILHILVEDTSFIEVPNVFTPNNDGFNDYFEIKSHFLQSCSIIIFNRWGTLMYESNEETVHWDGKNKDGLKVPAGTYFYSLDAIGKDGKKYSQKGALTLLR